MIAMLYGGFQHIDLQLLMSQPARSELELRCDKDKVFNRKKYFNTGRTATIYMFKHCGFKKGDVVLMPDYLCLSLLVAVEASELKYRFYRVDSDLNIDVEDLRSKLDEDVKAVYVTDFFGFPPDKKTINALRMLRDEWGIPIIEDITQTLFSKDDDCMGYADFMVCSTRKWMPMTDGGLLAVRDGAPFEDVAIGDGHNEAAYKQLLVSLMRDYFDLNPHKDRDFYVELEREANSDRYADLTVRAMTPTAWRIMMACDMEMLMRKRRENYAYLYDSLIDFENVQVLGHRLDYGGHIVPFGFLILVENRDDFNRYLMDKGIIGEIQWVLPKEKYTPGQDAAYLSEHNLMLHCDQRYGEREMEYVVKAVKGFFKQ